MAKKSLLIADDEKTIRETLSEFFTDNDYKVITAEDGLQAVQKLTDSDIDVALVDIRMPGLNGLEVLAKAQKISPGTQVIVITAFGTVENAVEAIQLGASDYVTKPMVFDDILIKVKRLMDLRRLTNENIFLLNELEDRYRFEGIVGTSKVLHDVLELARKLAQTNTSALITGETGTGKELIARAIHYHGITEHGRFVAINCAALPETLVESELFGHKRGAFTNATYDKIGLFRLADKGTIFLDEISSMPLTIQAKLLRAIERKHILPVGGTESVEVNARILCATNRDLGQEVQAGRFREDLYYRLDVVEIHLPALRERCEDVAQLANYFVAKYSRELNKPCPQISEQAMQAMMTYAWPGNVRELENVIERAVLFVDNSAIEPEDLAFVSKSDLSILLPGDDLKSALRVYEKQHILQILRRHDFDKNAAAQAMNIGLSSLYRKIDELGISRAEESNENPTDAQANP
ncbi:MAG: response regulator [Actinobacteria bacterium]|nr:response regulator [Actinomycetota bacterium]